MTERVGGKVRLGILVKLGIRGNFQASTVLQTNGIQIKEKSTFSGGEKIFHGKDKLNVILGYGVSLIEWADDPNPNCLMLPSYWTPFLDFL